MMVRTLLSLFVALMIAAPPVLLEAKSNQSSSGKSSYTSHGSIHKTYKTGLSGGRTYKREGISTYPKSTYKIGGTKYNASERYKNSGLPKVERRESVKKQFLKSKGYKRVPAGYEVDHIIPLSKGGRDEPSNMQLIPKNIHKQKTSSERKR
jgi:hypothetical protein